MLTGTNQASNPREEPFFFLGDDLLLRKGQAADPQDKQKLAGRRWRLGSSRWVTTVRHSVLCKVLALGTFIRVPDHRIPSHTPPFFACPRILVHSLYEYMSVRARPPEHTLVFGSALWHPVATAKRPNQLIPLIFLARLRLAAIFKRASLPSSGSPLLRYIFIFRPGPVLNFLKMRLGLPSRNSHVKHNQL